jgi:hypothetical protein
LFKATLAGDLFIWITSPSADRISALELVLLPLLIVRR